MSAPAMSSGLFEPPQFPTRQVLCGVAALLAVAVGPFLIWPTLADRILGANFLPHLYCYLGKPGLVWTHVVADSLIGLSYVMISGTLVYLVHKGRRDIPFHWMFLAFGSFIVACGGTHFMEVVTVWVPVYVLSAGVKIFTALVSVTTAVLLPFTVPQILSLIQTAKASEAAEGRFRALLEAAPDAMVVADKAGRMVLVNTQTERLFGYRRDELLGREIETLVPERLRGQHPGNLTEARVPPVETDLETYGLHKEGREFPIEISRSPLATAEGVLVSSAIRDITERKRAEQELRESEDRYRDLVEALPDAIFVVSEEQFLFVNPSGVRMLGARKPEQIVGKRLCEIVHSNSLESVRSRIRDCHQKGVPAPPMEHVLIALDGSFVDVESAAIPILWKGSPAIEAIARDIGERKRAEEALQTSEREQHKIAEQLEIERARLIEAQAVAKVGSWETELPSLDITWSEQTHRIFETDPSYFHPRRPGFVELVHPEDRAKVDATFEASLEKGAPSTVEYRIVLADGRVKVLEEHWKIFHDGQGRAARLIGTCQDVTERKQAEEALRRSESEAKARAEELAVILDAVPGMALISRDPEAQTITGSRVAYELLRLPYGTNISKSAPEEDRPLSFRVVKDGQELPPTELPLQKAAATGQVVRESEITLAFDDGTTREMLGNAAPLLNEAGLVRGAVGVFVDISERKRAEESLKLFRMLADQSTDAIEVVDPETLRFIDINDRACLDLGYTRKELLSMRVYDVDPNVDESLHAKVLDDLRASGSATIESLHRRKDGTTFPVEVSIKQVQLDRTYMIAVARDITERKRSEQALQESRAALTRVARIATMGELTASIAHEINQPLAAVVTNASASLHWLAMQPPDLAEARQAMASAMQEANRASSVVRRMPTLMKKASREMQHHDVNALIREVLAPTLGQPLASRVAEHTELGSDIPTVFGDRVQVQQVMLNLIMNAIDAMTAISGRPRTLRIKSARDSEGMLVQVEDSGEGIDPEQLPRIFDSFYTTKPQGIGMGLSISRSIIEAHDGRLWASAGSEGGAVLQFILPSADGGA